MSALDTVKVKRLVKAALPEPARGWIIERRREWLDKQLFRRHLRPTDTFIVAHPKSGNTWLAYMLVVLLQGDRDGRVNMKNLRNYSPHIHHHDSWIADYPALADPRVFRNEGPCYPDFYPKILYLLRDPRAVLISLYHMHNTIFVDKRMSFEAFLDEYLAYGCIRHWEPWQTRWDRQVLAWTRRAQRDARIVIVRYEDMVRDRRAVLARVAQFVGVPRGGEDLALAVDRGSFEAMRRDEEEHGAEAYAPEEQERGRFVRRGKIDGWRDEIDARSIARIEQALAPAMRITGYL